MIILVGASASGKTEIARYLAENYGIKKAITHTSREKRDGEKDGVEKWYYDDGQLRSVQPYKGGERYGVYKSYHNNGQLKAEVPYGETIGSGANGIAKFYDKKGNLECEAEYKDSIQTKIISGGRNCGRHQW